MIREGSILSAREGATPAEGLVKLIQSERGHLSTRQRVEGAEALASRTRRVNSPRPALAVAALSLGLASLLAVAAVLRLQSPRPALSFLVENGHVEREGVIAPDRAAPPVIRFSDGSEIALGARSSVRLRSLDSHGAFIAVSEGSARVDIVHAAGTKWTFEAGPFVIRVTGTAFTMSWNSAEKALDVRMDRGSVQVSGPLSDVPIALRSGQHLVVHVDRRETLIREDSDPSPNEASAAAAQLGPPSQATPSASSHAPFSAQASPPPLRDVVAAERWSAELAAGRADAVLRQAESRGLEACLSVARQEDVVALADAARYSRRDDLARRALLALRRRFPETTAARDATFLLGRLDEAGGDRAGALELYAQYLTEDASETYASEALGRKMTLTRQAFGDGRALPLADEYLRRFPRGTYAASAQALRGAR